ncbi:MAG: metal-dependent transcriptional regulator [Myxococcales bacterium]|nr:metal-dependent transcriptional regulator [Myxococcales bacterium]
MPTISVENYLKAIFHLQQEEDGPVGTKSVADRLEVSPASVTRMLKTLSRDGFLHHVPYRGAQLTEKGERVALRTIRNHRLVESFLIKTLGFSWDEVHREAEALEHALSEKVANRIDEYLGFPTVDPHGDPIPRADGSLAVSDSHTLGQSLATHIVRVIRVLDQRPEVLRYLADHGIRPGIRLEVLESAPFDGPLTVQAGNRRVSLARELSQKILVEQLNG